MFVEIVTSLLVTTVVYLIFLSIIVLVQFHGCIVADKPVKISLTFHVWCIAICSGLIFYSMMYLVK